MYANLNFRTLLLSLFLINFFNLNAQPGITFYTDVGKTNVSNGPYIKSATLGHYKVGKNTLETGFQLDLKSYNKNVFSGYLINASRIIPIKRIPISLHVFYVNELFSEILKETNWGVYLQMRHKRFDMVFGSNFRTYCFRKKAVDEFEIEKSATRLHEKFNIMYSFSYFLKPTDELWNIGLSITDMDYFIINQETNPMYNLQGIYKFNTSFCLYAQAWYKSAGVLNMSSNYFGFFFRTGLIWDIN